MKNSPIYIYPGSFSIKIYFQRLFNYKLIYWGDVEENKAMSMPQSKHFYEYSAAARDQVESYFNTHYDHISMDPVLISYLKKYVIMGYPNYYAFRKVIPDND